MAQTIITGGGAFTRQNITNLNDNFTALFGGQLAVGNTYYVKPDTLVTTGQQTGSLAKPFSTLAQGYNACLDGQPQPSIRFL